LICFCFYYQEFQETSDGEGSADLTNADPGVVTEGSLNQEENEPYSEGDGLDLGPEAWNAIEAFLAAIADRQDDDGFSVISEGSFPEIPD